MKDSFNMVVANRFSPKQDPKSPPKRKSWASKRCNTRPGRVVVWSKDQIEVINRSL